MDHVTVPPLDRRVAARCRPARHQSKAAIIRGRRGRELLAAFGIAPPPGFSVASCWRLIAQEVQKIAPEVVQKGSDGYLAVDYARLTPLLIEAVKEQQRSIRDHQQQIAERDRQISEIRRELDELKSLVRGMKAVTR